MERTLDAPRTELASLLTPIGMAARRGPGGVRLRRRHAPQGPARSRTVNGGSARRIHHWA